MRKLITLIASALSIGTMGCNPTAETEGLPRRGSSVAENSTPGDVVLSWNAGDASITSFDIYFGRSMTGTFAKAGTLTSFEKSAPAIALIKSDLKLTKGDTACFYVVAINAVGNSDPSDKLCEAVP